MDGKTIDLIRKMTRHELVRQMNRITPADLKAAITGMHNNEPDSIEVIERFIFEIVVYLAGNSQAFGAVDLDCVQNVLLKIMRYSERLVSTADSSLKSYIWRMVKNECLDAIGYRAPNDEPAVKIISLSAPWENDGDEDKEIQIPTDERDDTLYKATADEVWSLMERGIISHEGAAKRALIVVKLSHLGLTDEQIAKDPDFLALYSGLGKNMDTIKAMVRQDRLRGLVILKAIVGLKNAEK